MPENATEQYGHAAQQAVLKQYFGHGEFRPGQQPLIDGILAGRDVLGVMPTGGGKSACYQVPGVLLPGITVVISPLISLMKDQVAALCENGVAAAYLNSSLNAAQQHNALNNLRAGRYKIVYVAPERLAVESFTDLLYTLPISLLAVDEAHCISQWGQDFRPSYVKIADFIAGLPRRPVVAAFTATATGQVRQDIVRLLGLRDPVTEITGFDRPNLYFDVLHPKNKLSTLIALVEQRPGKSGIIYCATRSGVEKVCTALCDRGLAATRYHAGLDAAERQKNQEDFRFDRCSVMVATNAFGMGIDKSNISFVLHYNMPKSPEAYYQEAGRAGRDGEPAECILLFSPSDIATARFFIENSGNGNEELDDTARRALQGQDYRRLDQMAGYCKTSACLRGYMLDYFGQQHPLQCGNCGTCKAAFTEVDITTEAQMILSCIKRVKDRLGYAVGALTVVNVLRGGRDAKLQAQGLDEISTYGLLKDRTAAEVRVMIEALEGAGYLVVEQQHSTLQWGPKAGEVLFHKAQVKVMLRADKAPSAARKNRKIIRLPGPGGVPGADSDDLLAVLKSTRWDLAQREKVPAYIIFSNATLADMSEKAPTTMAELLEVSGVGSKKADRYGEKFLQVIQDFKKEKSR